MKKIILSGIFLTGFILAATAQTAAPAKNEVNAREQNQKARIKEGVKSGELTKKEAKNLKAQEKGIHDQVKDERAANGGKLTKGERKEANKELNHESKEIYNKKHNAKTQ